MNSRVATLSIVIALSEGDKLQVPCSVKVGIPSGLVYEGRMVGVEVGRAASDEEREE